MNNDLYFWCVTMKKYPEKFVDPSFMKDAKTLQDIKDCATYELIDVANKVIGTLIYSHEWMYVDLWMFRLVITWSSAYLSSFDTANLTWVDSEYIARWEQFQDVHALKSPIKYIGRDMFAKVLDICEEKNIFQLKMTPLQVTGSLLFYENMALYFSDRIPSYIIYPTGDMIFTLN